MLDAWRAAVGITGGTRVLAAVSGGADSMSLLHALHHLAEGVGVSLVVAHIDHGLRGMESDLDAAFVRASAARLGLRCEVARVDVVGGRAKRESLESAARRLRYDTLRRIAASAGCSVIATGHTLDDQAETVLMHLVRGAGIDGLGGMRSRTNEIVRPLLGISRTDVLAYLDAQAIEHREDATNADRGFRRNAIRADLLPMLERFNPRIRETLARTAALMARDSSYIQTQARQAFQAAIRSSSSGPLALDRTSLRTMPQGLRQHVIRLAVGEASGSLTRITMEHVESIDKLIVGDTFSARVSTPRGIQIEISGNALVLATRADGKAPPQAVALTIPGTVRFGDWTITARSSPPDVKSCGTVGFRVALRPDRARSGLWIRTRRPGDRLQLAGMQGHKKLQDLFVDRKLPRSERPGYPLVTDGSAIIWIPGFAVAADTLRDEGEEMVELTATRDIDHVE